MTIKLREFLEESSKKPYFDNITCKGLKIKQPGCSCAKSNKRKEKGKEFFVYTHRARSKGYPSLDKIPKSIIKFIESTG